jgi:hypothetical protein
MQFLSLEPFVPSGKDFDSAKQFFLALGFSINWDQGDYVGFQKDSCRFILQKYDQKDFADNFMLSVKVTDIVAFRNDVIEKKLPEQFGIRITKIMQMPYGKEVNIIDTAGVCWHFVEQ